MFLASHGVEAASLSQFTEADESREDERGHASLTQTQARPGSGDSGVPAEPLLRPGCESPAAGGTRGGVYHAGSKSQVPALHADRYRALRPTGHKQTLADRPVETWKWTRDLVGSRDLGAH